MNVSLSPIAEISLKQILETFNLSYSDYLVPLQLTEAQLQGTIYGNDLDLERSCIALSGEKPVGMGFLGIRGHRGWIGGMGVIPDYRGRGIGHMIMQSLIAEANKCNLEFVQLEVIEGNKPAHSLYLNLGFVEQRRLLILQASGFPKSNVSGELVEVSLDEALSFYHVFHRAANPWQREKESLTKAKDLSAWLFTQDHKPAAYLIGRLTPHMIQIMDAAFDAGKEDVVKGLLSQLSALQPDTPASIVNLPEDDPVWSVFQKIGFTESLAQIEMIYTINPQVHS